MNIKAIFLDLDNTLIPSENIYKEVRSELFVESNMGLNEFVYQEARSLIKEQLGHDHSSSHNRLIYFKKILEKMQKFSAIELLNVSDEYERRLEKKVLKYWNESRHEEVIRKLKKSFQLFILTNETLRSQLIKLRAIDPQGELFPIVLTSEEIGKEKPNHEIFLKAITLSGCSVKEICMVGDSISADIEPAIELGMGAILTQEFASSVIFENVEKQKYFQISSLCELEETIQKC